MITLQQYLMGRDEAYPDEFNYEILKNANETIRKVNELLSIDTNFYASVRSGWRPVEVNAVTPGASPHSKHITAQAIDLADTNRQLTGFCQKYLSRLSDLGLWMEAPECTPTWIHLQTVAPASGAPSFSLLKNLATNSYEMKGSCLKSRWWLKRWPILLLWRMWIPSTQVRNDSIGITLGLPN